jgi:hypothetical protein
VTGAINGIVEPPQDSIASIAGKEHQLLLLHVRAQLGAEFEHDGLDPGSRYDAPPPCTDATLAAIASRRGSSSRAARGTP